MYAQFFKKGIVPSQLSMQYHQQPDDDREWDFIVSSDQDDRTLKVFAEVADALPNTVCLTHDAKGRKHKKPYQKKTGQGPLSPWAQSNPSKKKISLYVVTPPKDKGCYDLSPNMRVRKTKEIEEQFEKKETEVCIEYKGQGLFEVTAAENETADRVFREMRAVEIPDSKLIPNSHVRTAQEKKDKKREPKSM